MFSAEGRKIIQIAVGAPPAADTLARKPYVFALDDEGVVYMYNWVENKFERIQERSDKDD